MIFQPYSETTGRELLRLMSREYSLLPLVLRLRDIPDPKVRRLTA